MSYGRRVILRPLSLCPVKSMKLQVLARLLGRFWISVLQVLAMLACISKRLQLLATLTACSLDFNFCNKIVELYERKLLMQSA